MKIEIKINTHEKSNRPCIQAILWKNNDFYYANGGKEGIVNCAIAIDKYGFKDLPKEVFKEMLECINFCIDGVLNGTITELTK